MGAYSLDTLVRKWGRGELTVEQVVGQILLNLQDLQDTVAGLERRVHQPSAGRRGEVVEPSGLRRSLPGEREDNEEDQS